MENSTKKPVMPLSEFEMLLIGAVGGAIETTLNMPIITMKFCLQEGRKLPLSPLGYYGGVKAQVGAVAPITAVQMGISGFMNRLLLGGQNRKLTNLETAVSSLTAGAVSSIIYSPADLITIQQQKLQLGLNDTIAHIIKNYGYSGMFRGVASCSLREAGYTLGYLGLADIARTKAVASSEYLREHDFASHVVGAWIGGSIGSFVSHPFDTAKTCVQSDMAKKHWTTATATIFKLYQEGGITNLWRGGIPRTVRACNAALVIQYILSKVHEFKEKQ